MAVLWCAFLVCFYGKPLTWGVLARFGVRVGFGQVKGPVGWVWLVKQTLYISWVVAGWFGWLCLRGMALREVLQEGWYAGPLRVAGLMLRSANQRTQRLAGPVAWAPCIIYARGDAP